VNPQATHNKRTDNTTTQTVQAQTDTLQHTADNIDSSTHTHPCPCPCTHKHSLTHNSNIGLSVENVTWSIRARPAAKPSAPATPHSVLLAHHQPPLLPLPPPLPPLPPLPPVSPLPSLPPWPPHPRPTLPGLQPAQQPVHTASTLPFQQRFQHSKPTRNCGAGPQADPEKEEFDIILRPSARRKADTGNHHE
jgi:hypothetical protein